ncbi:hypothetical protein F4814DRAFT_457904 [Daldinia grandis]|nr:hypothetical protein F4814DRAFT_457904 [Daldinia grandis]
METPQDTVVLGRANFEVLVQQANACNDYELGDIFAPGDIGPLMCLPMDEYNGLVLSQRQYANLTRRLMQEGMTDKRITALSQDELPSMQANNTKCKVPHTGQKDASTVSKKPRESRVLSSYDVIRGGSVLSLRLTSAVRTAFLSFVHEERAMSFYDHVQKHGLYVQHKKIRVSWGPRPRYINSELAAGIRNCEGKLTEREIREDMEHIKKLVIIEVMFSDGHCHIKTNSILDAMMTKIKYQNWAIQWDHDECSWPFKKGTPSKKPAARGRNRFTYFRKEDKDNDNSKDNGIDKDNYDN